MPGLARTLKILASKLPKLTHYKGIKIAPRTPESGPVNIAHLISPEDKKMAAGLDSDKLN